MIKDLASLEGSNKQISWLAKMLKKAITKFIKLLKDWENIVMFTNFKTYFLTVSTSCTVADSQCENIGLIRKHSSVICKLKVQASIQLQTIAIKEKLSNLPWSKAKSIYTNQNYSE